MISALGRTRRRVALGRRASVAVEFALCATFVLLPLFAGGTDFVEIISAQAQLNTTLQSLYLYAYANPTVASNTTNIAYVVAKINSKETHQVTFPVNNAAGTPNGAISYKCINAAGAYGVYSVATSSCPSGYTRQTYVSYQVNCSVNVTVPLPVGLTNPVALHAAGSVQIQ